MNYRLLSIADAELAEAGNVDLRRDPQHTEQRARKT
jgi:hypothetical protein